MSKKIFGIILCVFLALGAVFAIIIATQSPQQTDVTEINDIVKTAGETGGNGLNELYSKKNYTLKFAVIDQNGNLLYTNYKGGSLRQYDVIAGGGSSIDARGCTVLIYSDRDSFYCNVKMSEAVIIACAFTLSLLILIILGLYFDKVIVKPFYKMQTLARNIADGNLDVPLLMDKHNIFGAFTESFDLLRSELRRSRENERAADESKKQLVASLSHDIKTPLSSIKAITELMAVKATDAKEKERLRTIELKADQIGQLTNNLFESTLEELNELKITPRDEPTSLLKELLITADYENKLCDFNIPGALILCDRQRTQQVFDNVISNSYKYAGTAIKVKADISEGCLRLVICDSGGGAPQDELELLKTKFYRGKNAAGKSGSGIGLYMCNYIMNKMGGHFEIENRDSGFAAILYFKLS